ncbi:hypothetical protein [Azospirillum thermophilum]|uniref:hypothetical protein n=1 Tax=Azospirillum thermophilum TaxID=2202148 RepID=UPI003CCC03DB
MGFDAVLDGELLVARDGVVAPFNDLQQRLNRKTVTAAMLRDYPGWVRLYDILFEGRRICAAFPSPSGAPGWSAGARRSGRAAWTCRPWCPFPAGTS